MSSSNTDVLEWLSGVRQAALQHSAAVIATHHQVKQQTVKEFRQRKREPAPDRGALGASAVPGGASAVAIAARASGGPGPGTRSIEHASSGVGWSTGRITGVASGGTSSGDSSGHVGGGGGGRERPHPHQPSWRADQPLEQLRVFSAEPPRPVHPGSPFGHHPATAGPAGAPGALLATVERARDAVQSASSTSFSSCSSLDLDRSFSSSSLEPSDVMFEELNLIRSTLDAQPRPYQHQSLAGHHLQQQQQQQQHLQQQQPPPPSKPPPPIGAPRCGLRESLPPRAAPPPLAELRNPPPAMHKPAVPPPVMSPFPGQVPPLPHGGSPRGEPAAPPLPMPGVAGVFSPAVGWGLRETAETGASTSTLRSPFECGASCASIGSARSGSKRLRGDDAPGVLLLSAPPPIRPLALRGVPDHLVSFLTDANAGPHGGGGGGGGGGFGGGLGGGGGFGSGHSATFPGSGACGGSSDISNGATSMLDLVKYIAFDEDEFRSFVDLFGLKMVSPRPKASKPQRRGGGMVADAPGRVVGGGAPVLARSRDDKRLAEKQLAKKALHNDRVTAGQKRRAARAARRAEILAAGIAPGAFGALVLSGGGDSGDEGDGGGGGDLLPSETWSRALFDVNAFPALRLNAEAFLQFRMHREALLTMRQMLYAGLYRGAGGWTTKRVLVVDDSKSMRTFLKRLLEKQGFATDEAADGAAALELMQRRLYDVAFVDLEMPFMGGIDCATALRDWERGINRPQRQRICAVSAHTDSKERRAVLAGFDHYRTKPIRGPLLIEVARSSSAQSLSI